MPEGLDSEGWYTLPKPKKEIQGIGADERDLSLWVVFSKQMGSEKILVSLPGEPTYQYMDESGKNLEVLARSDTAEYRLQVVDRIYANPNTLIDTIKHNSPGAIFVGQNEGITQENSLGFSEVSYWKEGQWYFDRVVVTGERTYFLQIKSIEHFSDAHLKFINSFSVEIRAD